MLEVRYNTNTKKVTGWCGDPEQFGNLKDRGNETIVVLDIPIPEKPMEAYLMKADLTGLEDNPDYLGPPPPLCTHWARIDSFHPDEVKPMRVKRTWNEKEYTVDCYVTETIKDQYLAGDMAVGDFVLVHFLEDNPDRAIVIAKVYQTW